MNRPFYAFGVLMAFLALAIVAIGLSTQPTAQSPDAGASRLHPPVRAKGPTAYIVVLRDDDAARAAIDALAEVAAAPVCGTTVGQPTYEQGCGLDRITGEVYGISELGDCFPSASRPDADVLWRPVVIAAATNPGALDVGASQGLTQYDAAYDLAMFSGRFTERSAVSRELSESMLEDQQVSLFESLCPGETTQSEQISPAVQQHTWLWIDVVKTKALAIANRVWRTIVMWVEIEAWIDSTQVTVAGLDTPGGGEVAFWSPPQGQVVQIAVASLNRVAELLRGAIAR